MARREPFGGLTAIRKAETRRQKHDRRDAALLLQLLAEDRFPAIWMPSTELRDLRALLLSPAPTPIHSSECRRSRSKDARHAPRSCHHQRRRARERLHALARTLTLGATYAASRGDFLGGSGRGFYSNQLDPRFLVLGNLLTQQATPADIAAAQAMVSGVGLPYPNFMGTIGQMLRPFPQYSGVTDVYGDLAQSTYQSLQLTVEKRRSDDGLIVNFNYTFSRTRDNLSARTGYNFDQDWVRRGQRSAARLERTGRLQPAIGHGRETGQQQSACAGDRQGLADLRHHAVPVRPSARSDWRRL